MRALVSMLIPTDNAEDWSALLSTRRLTKFGAEEIIVVDM